MGHMKYTPAERAKLDQLMAQTLETVREAVASFNMHMLTCDHELPEMFGATAREMLDGIKDGTVDPQRAAIAVAGCVTMMGKLVQSGVLPNMLDQEDESQPLAGPDLALADETVMAVVRTIAPTTDKSQVIDLCVTSAEAALSAYNRRGLAAMWAAALYRLSVGKGAGE